MPFYLYQDSYTPEAMKAMIAGPSDRKAAAAALAEGLGGKLHAFYFAFGENDVVAIFEMPDDKAMAAAAMLVAGSGTVSRGRTTKLLTVEEAMAAMGAAAKAAGAYKPVRS